jgi:hypothetical protein
MNRFGTRILPFTLAGWNIFKRSIDLFRLVAARKIERPFAKGYMVRQWDDYDEFYKSLPDHFIERSG